MIRTIAHRELRNSSGEVLRAVQGGETIHVTNHGQVVAVLAPVGQATQSLPVRRARLRGGFSELPRVRRDRPVQDALDDLRGMR